MASSLSNLSNNPSEGIHRIKCKFGHDDKKCETCGMKYKHCDCFLEYTNFKDDLTLIWIKWVCVDPSTIILATIFTLKIPESSGLIYSSILTSGNICHYNLTWSGLNSQEIVNFFQFSSGTRGPTTGTKFTISCEFGPFQVKWWCHTFSNMK